MEDKNIFSKLCYVRTYNLSSWKKAIADLFVPLFGFDTQTLKQSKYKTFCLFDTKHFSRIYFKLMPFLFLYTFIFVWFNFYSACIRNIYSFHTPEQLRLFHFPRYFNFCLFLFNQKTCKN